MKHLKIIIEGTVQGVSFRSSARREADKLGLHGFARNEPDGTVYIEVEGQEDGLDKFLLWCHEGPQDAAVKSVTSSLDEPVNHEGFEKL